MKKLIVAAALVCAAAVTQATTFKWGTSAQAYGPAVANLTVPGVYSPGTANNDRMKAEGTNQGVTWTYSMILTATVGTTVTTSDEITGTITSYSSNKINQDISTDFFTLPTDDSTKNYAWDIVITGTMTVGTDVYTITSDHITGSRDFTSLSNASISTGVPGQWTVTPEPTSGLLLLLGAAGLALKRKRA